MGRDCAGSLRPAGRLLLSFNPFAAWGGRGLAGSKKSYHCYATDNAGSIVMQATRCGLSIVSVSMATLLIGIGEARSQAGTAQLQLCNQSNGKTYVAVARQAGINDQRLVLSGWYPVDAGTCTMMNLFLPWGNVYLFADDDQGDTWSGNDERFCVTNDAFTRWIDPSPGCPPGNYYVAGFIRYSVANTAVWTWTMGPVQ